MPNERSLGAAAAAFDLESQTGVMHVLASVRASDLPKEAKNELRDLVFLYINGGRDTNVRLNLEQKLKSFAVAPAAPLKAEKFEARPEYEFGSSRPAPSFSTPVVSTPTPPTTEAEPESAEPKSAPEPKSTTDAAPAPAQAPQTKFTPNDLPTQPSAPPQSTPKPAAASPAPNSESKPAPAEAKEAAATAPPASSATNTNQAPAPRPVPQPEPKPAAPASTPAPSPVEPPTPEAPTAPPTEAPRETESGLKPDQYLQRIREIKAGVNERVGNPVNLVDIDNAVGREYMSALLEAMKKVNGAGTAAPSMDRLEAAFTAVKQILDEHDAESSAVASSGVPKPPEAPLAPEPPATSPPAPGAVPNDLEAEVVPDANTAESFASAPTPSAPKAPSETRQHTPPPPPAANQTTVSTDRSPEEAVAVTPPKPPRVSEPVSTVQPPPAAPATPTEKPVEQTDDATLPAAVPSGAPAPRSRNLTPKEIATAWGPETDTRSSTTETHNQPNSPATRAVPLAESKTKLRTPDELPEPSSLETSSVAGDPLYTRQVDDGLNQLLSEWSLFKKSGLFGTGPKGVEHPLFQKIKDLQIPLLLAGRFEGATQEIKQSITDYMNGWRYEQGIIYEQGETFEHYLRRVIRHILDLQKNNE